MRSSLSAKHLLRGCVSHGDLRGRTNQSWVSRYL